MKATDICFWSVVDSERSGTGLDWLDWNQSSHPDSEKILWSDTEEGLDPRISHFGPLHRDGGLFFFEILQERMTRVEADLLVWTNVKERRRFTASDLYRLMHGSPIHIPVIAWDQARIYGVEIDPLMEKEMRGSGVRHRRIGAVHPDFVIIKRRAIEKICQLAWRFYWQAEEHGLAASAHDMLSYVMHMLCGNPRLHIEMIWSDDCLKFGGMTRNVMGCSVQSPSGLL